MTPHLVRWHHEFADEGLVVVEVNDGRIDNLDALQRHVRSEAIPFAVLHDAEGIVTSAYGVRAYPTAYLIDRDGNVIWEGNPSPDTVDPVLRAALGG